MQKHEKINQFTEMVIFESSKIEIVLEPGSEIEDVMDIPGTAHQKLEKLAEMI